MLGFRHLARRDDFRLALDGEVHRIGNEALFVRGFMEGAGRRYVAARHHGHGGAQHNASEPASAVAAHFHHSLGTIGIGGHDNPGFGGEVEIPEFVASRQRCDEDGRDWLRKGLEAWFTALIELAWGKRRIMEIYLNVAEWGPGLYGAEAAARHYFHKPADALDPSEAVRLAAALPDPLDWSARRPGRRLLARGAAIRANLQGLPTALPLPCGAGRS